MADNSVVVFSRDASVDVVVLRRALRPDSYTLQWRHETSELVLSVARGSLVIFRVWSAKETAIRFARIFGFPHDMNGQGFWYIHIEHFVLESDGSPDAHRLEAALTLSRLPYVVKQADRVVLTTENEGRLMVANGWTVQAMIDKIEDVRRQHATLIARLWGVEEE